MRGCITIRLAGSDDTAALRRLAALDSAPALRGATLIAQVDGELCAARALGDGRVVADPFRFTAELGDLLRVRAAQLSSTDEFAQRRGGSLVPRRRRPMSASTVALRPG